MFENGLHWTGEYFDRGLARWPSGINSPAIPSSLPRVRNPVAALAPHPAFSSAPRPPQLSPWAAAWRGLFRSSQTTSLLGALGALSFSMNRSAYAVGERPTYSITGAQPGGQIAWTSFKDGVATGEYQAFYGQYTDEQGNWSEQAVQPFSEADVGVWQKQAIVISSVNAPNDTIETAQFFFTVGSPAGANEPGQPSSGGGLFGGSINLFGVQIPTIVLIGGGVVALLAFSKK